MTNPYEPTTSASDTGQANIPDTKTTLAFWCGLGCGAASWVTAALTFRFGMEALYVGPPPAYAYAVMPATLMFGIASCVLLAYVYRRRLRHPNHRLTAARFVIVGLPACIPVALLIFTILDGLGR
ncbi:MAG: hypothetical protein AAGG48_32265 [Planctomycetota bacterium]